MVVPAPKANSRLRTSRLVVCSVLLLILVGCAQTRPSHVRVASTALDDALRAIGLGKSQADDVLFYSADDLARLPGATEASDDAFRQAARNLDNQTDLPQRVRATVEGLDHQDAATAIDLACQIHDVHRWRAMPYADQVEFIRSRVHGPYGTVVGLVDSIDELVQAMDEASPNIAAMLARATICQGASVASLP